MRVCTVVGARPQFVKSAVVSPELERQGITEALVHTGQHYDDEMSRDFFDTLPIPMPAANFGVGSGSHAEQTGRMMIDLEQYLLAESPFDWLIVYGDTNSTLAAALVAAKLHIPLAHVESGLRSGRRSMPEEINRVVADRLASALFCPTETAVSNLRAEGIEHGVHLSGDVMREAVIQFGPEEADTRTDPYYVCTVHRAENVLDKDRLQRILDGLGQVGIPVSFPSHPRTRSILESLVVPSNVAIGPPVGYRSMLALVKNAAAVLTDSGGLQKEAYWLGVPCITLRAETEWIETLQGGWNRLVDDDPDAIVSALRPPVGQIDDSFGLGPGRPSEVIVRTLVSGVRNK